MAKIEEGELKKMELWLQKFEASKNSYKDFFKQAKENYRLYKSYKEEGMQRAYTHSIFVPYCYAYTEDFTSYFMLSLLASPTLATILPRYGKVSPEMCSELETIIQVKITQGEIPELFLELEEMIKSVNISNVGYLISYPLLNANKKLDNIYFLSPDALSIYPEPNVKRLSRAKHVIKWGRERWDILKSLEGDRGGFKNLDELLGQPTGGEEDPVVEKLKSVGLNHEPALSPTDKKEDKIEIIDCFEDGHVITIGNRRRIIRDTKEDDIAPYNFRLPMLDCRLGGAPGEFFGVALIESIKPTQRELNILRSERRENVAIALNKTFIYDYMAGEVAMDSLVSAPGNIVLTSNMDALKELQISDVTRGAFEESRELQFDFQNISSLTDYSRGQIPRRKETATGIIRLQQAAQGRSEWLLRKVDLYVITPLIQRCIYEIHEYMDPQEWAEIIGEDNHADEFFNLSADSVKKQFAILPATESISQIKETDVNQFLAAYDRMIRVQGINQIGLVKALLLKMGQKNLKDILPKLSPQSRDITAGIASNMPPRAAMPGMPVPSMPGIQQ